MVICGVAIENLVIVQGLINSYVLLTRRVDDVLVEGDRIIEDEEIDEF